MVRPSTPVTREAVIDAALRIVEQEGVRQLSMRKLAAEGKGFYER